MSAGQHLAGITRPLGSEGEHPKPGLGERAIAVEKTPMKVVFFDFVIHFGGGPQLAADTVTRLAARPDIDIEVIDAYGACEPYLSRLAEAGVKVHILVPETSRVVIGYQNKRFVRLIRLFHALPDFWRLRRRLIRTVRQIDPDVIWSNSPKGMAFLGTSLSLLRYPLVREYIGCPPAEEMLRYDRWLMRRRAQVIMAISTETGRQLQRAGVPAEKIEVVYDTIDVQDTLRRAREPLEAPLPDLDKHPRVVVAGTLLPKKGQDTAIRAMVRLKAAGHDPTLWLAGDVIGNDDSYFRRLKQLACDGGVSQSVHFLGWRHDVPAIMAHADVVVHPSHQEGFCHAILEAMLLERPVVASPVGGIQDSIQDGQTGFLVPVGDDALMADRIRRLMADAELVAEMTKCAYKVAAERFAPEHHTEKVLASLTRATRTAGRLNFRLV